MIRRLAVLASRVVGRTGNPIDPIDPIDPVDLVDGQDEEDEEDEQGSLYPLRHTFSISVGMEKEQTQMRGVDWPAVGAAGGGVAAVHDAVQGRVRDTMHGAVMVSVTLRTTPSAPEILARKEVVLTARSPFARATLSIPASLATAAKVAVAEVTRVGLVSPRPPYGELLDKAVGSRRPGVFLPGEKAVSPAWRMVLPSYCTLPSDAGSLKGKDGGGCGKMVPLPLPEWAVCARTLDSLADGQCATVDGKGMAGRASSVASVNSSPPCIASESNVSPPDRFMLVPFPRPPPCSSIDSTGPEEDLTQSHHMINGSSSRRADAEMEETEEATEEERFLRQAAWHAEWTGPQIWDCSIVLTLALESLLSSIGASDR